MEIERDTTQTVMCPRHGVTANLVFGECRLCREARMARERAAEKRVRLSSGNAASGMIESPGPGPRTLKSFIQDQKRAACALCQLPSEAKDQLRELAGIKRETVVAWIAAEYSVNVSVEDLDRHKSERH